MNAEFSLKENRSIRSVSFFQRIETNNFGKSVLLISEKIRSSIEANLNSSQLNRDDETSHGLISSLKVLDMIDEIILEEN